MKKPATTAVVFRTFKGSHKETAALFPYEIDSFGRYGAALCSSFEHIGQHGGADYEHVIRQTRPATATEIAELTAELTRAPYGYVLRPILRRNRNTYGAAVHTARMGY